MKALVSTSVTALLAYYAADYLYSSPDPDTTVANVKSVISSVRTSYPM